MPEQNGFASFEKASSDQVNHPSGGSPGINWIEQQPFQPGKQTNSLALRFSDHPIPAAQVIGIGQYIRSFEGRLLAEEIGCLDG